MNYRFLAALAFTAAIGVAQTVTEVPHDKMRGMLQGMGFEITEKAFDNSIAFYFQLNGYKVTLINNVKDMQRTN